MFRYAIISLTVFFVLPVSADVISYECTSFPEEAGDWIRSDRPHLADRWIDDGWFVQHAEIVDPGPPYVPEDDFYRHSLAQFIGENLFVDWRVETDGPREGIPDCAPAGLVVGGQMGVLYHFTIAEDQVRLIDSDLNGYYVDIEPGVSHTYRLELYAEFQYRWYIDGELILYGPVPDHAYPTDDSVIKFGITAVWPGPTTVWWDYIRFGTIAHTPGKNDPRPLRDSDGFYYLEEPVFAGEPKHKGDYPGP